MNTLRLEAGNFVEDDLKEYYNDVLYSVQMQGNAGYLYVLIEHQSSPDKKMAFRLLRYAIATMHRHLAADHEHLPLVIPILFYQGNTTPYPHSTCWLDMFASPELARRLYSNPFPLVDITVIPDDEIMRHRRVAVLELLQKHIRQRDLMLLQERLVKLLAAEYTTGSQLKALINYILQRGHTEQPGIFYRELAHRVPKEESMMTIAEWLEEQGMLKGEMETKRRVAARLLENGMSSEMVARMTELTEDEIEQLSH